jgi:hypothetical protein
VYCTLSDDHHRRSFPLNLPRNLIYIFRRHNMIKKKTKIFYNFDLKLKLDKNITLHSWMILFSREFSSILLQFQVSLYNCLDSILWQITKPTSIHRCIIQIWLVGIKVDGPFYVYIAIERGRKSWVVRSERVSLVLLS